MGNKIDIIANLSSSQDRKDELPNIELARKIGTTQNIDAVKELIRCVKEEKNAIVNDSIKVLYELGETHPQLLVPHLELMVEWLKSKNNRLQWGSMTAIACVARVAPEQVNKYLMEIVLAADKGSVITRDKAIQVFISLVQVSEFRSNAAELIYEQLTTCPPNQLPMYAEQVLNVVEAMDKKLLLKKLEQRLPDLEKESKRKRLLKVIRKIS